MSDTLGATIGSQSAADSSKQLELLIHSLTHEDTRDNVGRHQLVLQKWCRDYREGFFVRDLFYVMEIFNVLRERMCTHPDMFRPILSSVLTIAALPLFEAKANERLRATSIDLIKRYFYDIAAFWSYEQDGIAADLALNSEITKCFRCIVNGGLDPAILQADIAGQKWQNDGFRIQVTETTYLQTQLRESGCVTSLVDHFLVSASLYEQEFDKHTAFLESVAAAQREKDKLMKKGVKPAVNPDDDSDDEPVTTSKVDATSAMDETVMVGAPSKELLADYQELLGRMRNLMMELTVDPKTAAQLAADGLGDGAIRLLKIASDNSPRDPQVSFTVDILWTCLDAYLSQAPVAGGPTAGPASPSTMAEPVTLAGLTSAPIMNFEMGVRVLNNVFLMLLHQGYRMADKECRNEVLVVLTMLASFPAALPSFLSTGALNVLLTYCNVVEMGETPHSWPFYTLPVAKMRNYGSIHDIDLQLKRGMWLAVAETLASDDTDALLAVASSPLMDNLMGYLEFDSLEQPVGGGGGGLGSPSRAAPSQSQVLGDGEGGRGSVMMEASQTSSNQGGFQEGSQTSQYQHQQQQQSIPGYHFIRQLPRNQLLELQVQAAAFLAEVAPKILGEFLRIQGPVRFLDIAHKYSKSQVPEHKSLVYQSLLLLNRCLMLSREVKHIMEAENAIETFLTQFEYSDEEDTRTLVARLISILCSDNNAICQAQLREQNGIRLMVRVLTAYSERRRTQVGRKARLTLNAVNESEDGAGGTVEDAQGGQVSIMVVAILDCLARAVVGNVRSEIALATNEGVDALLNLLEVSQALQRVQVLRLLSDLLENSKLLSFLHAWRSPKTMRPAAQMIAHCWLDEEARLGVTREQGVLNNINDPLQCHQWPEAQGGQQPGESLSSDGSMTLGMKSLAVTRLSEAISKARVVNGVVPGSLREEVLDKDTRGTIASILVLIGVMDAFNANPPGFVGNYSNLQEGSNIVLDQDSSLLIAPHNAEMNPQNLQNSVNDGGAMKLNIDEINEGGDHETKSPETSNKQQPLSPLEQFSPTQNHGGEQPASSFIDGEQGFSASQVPTVIISNEPGLGPMEKQVVAIANQYGILREGEWWKSVQEDLKAYGVEPVEADQAKIQERLKLAFEAAFLVQSEQMELHGYEISSKKETEDAFVGQIIAKKEQQIKTLYLKKKGKGGATANPHAARPY